MFIVKYPVGVSSIEETWKWEEKEFKTLKEAEGEKYIINKAYEKAYPHVPNFRAEIVIED